MYLKNLILFGIALSFFVSDLNAQRISLEQYNQNRKLKKEFKKALSQYKNDLELEPLKTLANKGYTDAMIVLGEFYESENTIRGGKNPLQDSVQAFHWWKKLAEHNHPRGLNALGNYYFHGEFVTSSKEKAINYWKRAANLNNANAIISLAVIYYNEEYGYYDIEKSLFWLKKFYESDRTSNLKNNPSYYIAEKDNSLSLETKFYLYYNGITSDQINENEIIGKLLEMGEGGDVQAYAVAAKYLLSIYEKYKDSRGNEELTKVINSIEKQTKEIANKAASKSNADALYVLGKLSYHKGNYQEAYNNFTKSADGKNPEAMVQLAIMYDFGKHVAKNKDLAKYWAKKASELGSDRALEYLADLDLETIGIYTQGWSFVSKDTDGNSFYYHLDSKEMITTSSGDKYCKYLLKGTDIPKTAIIFDLKNETFISRDEAPFDYNNISDNYSSFGPVPKNSIFEALLDKADKDLK